jgi:hypothetical protein
LDCNHCAKKSAFCLNDKVQKTSGQSSVRNDTLNPCPKKSGPENQKRRKVAKKNPKFRNYNSGIGIPELEFPTPN